MGSQKALLWIVSGPETTLIYSLKNPNPHLLYKKTVTALLAKEKKLTKQLKEAVGNSIQYYRLGVNSKLRLLLAL